MQRERPNLNVLIIQEHKKPNNVAGTSQRICQLINKLGTSSKNKKSMRNHYKASSVYLINKEEGFSSFSHSVIYKFGHSFSDFTQILCPRLLQIIKQKTNLDVVICYIKSDKEQNPTAVIKASISDSLLTVYFFVLTS